MNKIKRALLSVSNKTGIVDFARELTALNIEIISTGGTSQLLRKEQIPVRDVAEITHFPEIMDGRVKTLHPQIHGGILGLRDKHAEIAIQNAIDWIDLVIVNLYPFAETVKKPNTTLVEAIENIDIGGPSMIRSAAKNHEWVGIVVDPSDYQIILHELRLEKKLSCATRKKLAIKAFQHTAQYDDVIHRYLAEVNPEFTDEVNFNFKKHATLRYGENPHQKACAYIKPDVQTGILVAKQYQGKELSYNNIVDADAAIACVNEFSEPACVIVKHANPCGVAIGDCIDDAFTKAFHADSVSAFGGVVALNRVCTKQIAEFVTTMFMEIIIAPGYETEALDCFSKKSNLRILENKTQVNEAQQIKFIAGGILIQDKDNSAINLADLKVVTAHHPTAEELQSLLFAWRVVKHIKSNAILIAKNNTTLGIGAGQVSRIDAVEIAIKKAGEKAHNAVLASDAFFPFRDSIDQMHKAGISAIIQPGGSIKDKEVITACNELGTAMVFTGVRCFRH